MIARLSDFLRMTLDRPDVEAELAADPLQCLAAAERAELVVVDNANRCIDRLAPGALSRLAGGMAGLSLTAGLTYQRNAFQVGGSVTAAAQRLKLSKSAVSACAEIA